MISAKRLTRRRNYVTLPRNLLTTQHTLIENFEVLTDFTVEGSSVAVDDITNFMFGSQSIQLTTPTAAQGYINKVFTPTLDFSATPVIRIRFYIADKTLMTAGALMLSHSAANYTNGFQYTSIAVGAVRNGWNFRNIPKADFSTMGAGTWATPIAQARWRATGATGVKAVFSWDYMTAGVLGTPVVCFQFDDQNSSVYSLAYPIMRAHNIPGTVYAISDTIGAGGKMTVAQLAELYAAGWDIANHTADHANLTTLSQADAQTDIAACTAVLNGNGWTRASLHLNYPGGAYNATVKAAATAEGVLTACTFPEGGVGYEIMPFGENLALNPSATLNAARTLASAKTIVDTALSKGGILIFGGHDIVTGAPVGEQWKDTDFASLCDYIVQLKLSCVTISKLYGLLSGSVRVPKLK